MKVLIIGPQESVKQACEAVGMQVITAAAMSQGFCFAYYNFYQAIVLDLDAPGTQGLTTLQHFIAMAKGAVVIVLSKYDDAQMRRSALELGANAYFVKYFRAELLVERIEYLVPCPRALPFAHSDVVLSTLPQ